MDRTIKTMLIAGVLSLYCVSASAVTVPNTFSANTPAVAAEVNENFSVLEDAINNAGGSVAFKQRKIIESSGVGRSECLSSEVVVSASCYCTGNPEKGSNFGVTFACTVNGNGVVGACFPYLYNSRLSNSPVEIIATCAASDSGFRDQSKDKLESLIDSPAELKEDNILEQLREQAARMNEKLAADE